MTLLDECAKLLIPKAPQLSETEQKQFDFLTSMNLDGYGAVLIQGKPRTGKSMFQAYLAYLRRKFFGNPVVSNVPLKPAFGDYELADVEWLVTELEKVNQTIESEAQDRKKGHKKLISDTDNENICNLWEKAGIKLYRSTTLFDEMQTGADKRRAMANMNLILGYLCQQFGHYENLLLMVAHDKALIDAYRQEPFVTHDVLCGYYRDFPRPYCKATDDLGTCIYQVFHRHTPIWTPDDGLPPWNPQMVTLEVRNWKGLFDTNAPVGVPRNILKGLMKENKIYIDKPEPKAKKIEVDEGEE